MSCAARRAVRIALAGAALLATAAPAAAASAPPRPVVLGLSPLSGPSGRPIALTVHGSHFIGGATSVSVGGVRARSVRVLSPTELTAVAPAGGAGTVDVQAATAGGLSETNAAAQLTRGGAAPANLRAVAAGSTEIGLAWSPPAAGDVAHFVVYRDGRPIAKTGPFATGYVDSAIAPGSAHSYSVGARLAAGRVTARSATVHVTAAAAAQPLSACSAQRLDGGVYELTADLTAAASQGCLTFTHARGLVLDCRGHSVYGTVLVSASSDVLIVNCVFVFDISVIHALTIDGHYADAGVVISGSSDAILARSRFVSGPGRADQIGFQANADQGLVVMDDSFSDEVFQQTDTSASALLDSTFTARPSQVYGELVLLQGGSHNVVAGNTLSGGAPQNGGQDRGSDDGIVLQGDGGAAGTGPYESDDVISANRISGMWDAGIETLGLVANTTITANAITRAYVTGVGAYHSIAWVNDQVSANAISASGHMFLFMSAIPRRSPPVYFMDNTFSGNVFADPEGSFGHSGEAVFALWRSVFRAVTVLSPTNAFVDNNFGPGAAPYFDTGIGAVVGRNWGNTCPPPGERGGVQLVCAGPRGMPPALSALAPARARAGASVTLRGGGLAAGAAVVSFGNVPAEIVRRAAGTLVVRVPAHARGAVAVRIATQWGTSAPAAFTYLR